MTTPTRRLLTLALLPLLLAVSPAADRFERTKARIDALLSRRLQPEPLPAKIANPFLVAGSGAPDAGPVTPPQTESLLTGDDEVLAHYGATLKVSGEMMIGGQMHLIVNSSPYKEGSQILVRGKNDTTYYLKVLRIAPNELTLGYNDATLVVPYKN